MVAGYEESIHSSLYFDNPSPFVILAPAFYDHEPQVRDCPNPHC
jgi:hypothetical protein